MSLLTVNLRLVRPQGIDDTPMPASGRVDFIPVAHGKYGSSLRTVEKVSSQIVDGEMVPVELTPGPWKVTIQPAKGNPWPEMIFTLIEGMEEPVNLADLLPEVVIDGRQLAKGESAYEVAVRNGYTGTEDEWIESLKPDIPTWADLSGKPSDFPPAAHDHDVSDVTGLAGILDALKTTEWQKCDGVTSLPAGTIWWRWYRGAPELQFRDAEWTRSLVIPWKEMAPAPPVDSIWVRHAADISQSNNLINVSRVVMWNGGLYFTSDSPSAMRGVFPYSI